MREGLLFYLKLFKSNKCKREEEGGGGVKSEQKNKLS